ncbi:MAG: DUF4349 domain-containing protein [Acidimicrobiales bacterium]
MTTIDEGQLRRELRGAADAFEVSRVAVDRVVAAARSPRAPGRVARTVSAVRDRPGRQRLFAVAALAAAVTAITVPLLATESGPPTNVVSGTSYFSPAALPRTSSNGQTLDVVQGRAVHGAVRAASSTRIESTGQENLTVAKGRIGSAFSALSELATRDGGRVVNSQIQTANGANGHFAYGSIVLQVPQARFADLVGRVKAVGRVTFATTSSVDVTGQYVDLRARITALEAGRRQYLAILAKATTIGDILAVQARLNSVQSRLEQLQGQLMLLDHQTTYASLTVNVSESGHHGAAHASTNGLVRAFHEAVHGFVAGAEWLVRASGPALFAVLCLGVLLLLARRAWRSLRRRAL